MGQSYWSPSVSQRNLFCRYCAVLSGLGGVGVVLPLLDLGWSVSAAAFWGRVKKEAYFVLGLDACEGDEG